MSIATAQLHTKVVVFIRRTTIVMEELFRHSHICFPRDLICLAAANVEANGKPAYLSQYVIGCYVRVTLPGPTKPTARPVRVLGFKSKPAPYEVDYQVRGVGADLATCSTKKLSTSLLLVCWDASTRRLEEISLAFVSSKPSLPDESREATAILTSAHASELHVKCLDMAAAALGDITKDPLWRFRCSQPTAAHFAVLKQMNDAISSSQMQGQYSMMKTGELWGCNEDHNVTIVCRSWKANDLFCTSKSPTAGQKRKREESDTAFVVPPLDASVVDAISTGVLPVLDAQGRGIDENGYGSGRARKKARVVGQYRYCTFSTDSGTDFPHVQASQCNPFFGNEYQPEATAWLHLLRLFPQWAPTLSLSLFKEKGIICQIDSNSTTSAPDDWKAWQPVVEWLDSKSLAPLTKQVECMTPTLPSACTGTAVASTRHTTTTTATASPDNVGACTFSRDADGTVRVKIAQSADQSRITAANPVRNLASNHQIYIIDFDALIDACGGGHSRSLSEFAERNGYQWLSEDEMLANTIASMTLTHSSITTTGDSEQIVDERERLFTSVPTITPRVWHPRIAPIMIRLSGLTLTTSSGNVVTQSREPTSAAEVSAKADVTVSSGVPAHYAVEYLPAVPTCLLLSAAGDYTGKDVRMYKDDRFFALKSAYTPSDVLSYMLWAYQVAAETARHHQRTITGLQAASWRCQSEYCRNLSVPVRISATYTTSLLRRLNIQKTEVSFAPWLHSWWNSMLFPHRYGASKTVLYHGTHSQLAGLVLRDGFKRPGCRMTPQCITDHCECQMEAFGVYLAEYDKAADFAGRKAVYDAGKGGLVGAVLHVAVDVGHVKTATAAPCPCPCGKSYVDHAGRWYEEEGYDTLFLRDKSLPASNFAEWAVADPWRCKVLEITEKFTKVDV